MPANRITSESPWHVVLVLDDSGSMAGNPSALLCESLKSMHAEMEITAKGTKPYFRVSIIAFGSSAKVIAEAQSEKDIDIDSVATFSGSSGSTAAHTALSFAYDLLKQHPGKATDFRPFVFFLSDGQPDDAHAARMAADKVKTLDIPAGQPTIITVGFGSVDKPFMEAIASAPELFVHLQSPAELTKFFPAIGTVAGSKTGEAAIKQAIINI